MEIKEIPTSVIIDGHNLIHRNFRRNGVLTVGEREARNWLLRRAKKLKQNLKCPVRVMLDSRYGSEIKKEGSIEISYENKERGGADKLILKELAAGRSEGSIVVSDDHHITEGVRKANSKYGRNIRLMQTATMFEMLM